MKVNDSTIRYLFYNELFPHLSQDSEEGLGFSCECLIGFTGEHCETVAIGGVTSPLNQSLSSK